MNLRKIISPFASIGQIYLGIYSCYLTLKIMHLKQKIIIYSVLTSNKYIHKKKSSLGSLVIIRIDINLKSS